MSAKSKRKLKRNVKRNVVRTRNVKHREPVRETPAVDATDVQQEIDRLFVEGRERRVKLRRQLRSYVEQRAEQRTRKLVLHRRMRCRHHAAWVLMFGDSGIIWCPDCGAFRRAQMVMQRTEVDGDGGLVEESNVLEYSTPGWIYADGWKRAIERLMHLRDIDRRRSERRLMKGVKEANA